MPAHPSPVSGVDRRHLISVSACAMAMPVATRALARAVQAPATEEDTRLMRLPIEEAALGDYPFGAVITRDAEVLARGHNPGIKHQDPTAHGEIMVIRRFLAEHGPEKLVGTTLYTAGEPCAMCMGAIIWCGIGRLVYAASMAQLATKINQIMVTSTAIAEDSPFADIVITGGMLADEAMKLFR